MLNVLCKDRINEYQVADRCFMLMLDCNWMQLLYRRLEEAMCEIPFWSKHSIAQKNWNTQTILDIIAIL